MEQKHILLIEDDETMIRSIIYSLEKAGYKVENTVSGRLGVELALKTHPDLIISDLILPDINGAEAIAEVRRDVWGKEAKVLILTNIDEEQAKQKLKSLNVLKYMIKVENTLKQIAETVDHILKPVS